MGGSTVAFEYLLSSLYHQILGLGLPSAIQRSIALLKIWPNVSTGGSVINGGTSMVTANK